MKKIILYILLSGLSVTLFGQYARGANGEWYNTNAYGAHSEIDKDTTPEDAAYIEAERLGKELKLNDYQIFFIDSMLQVNLRGLKTDMDKLQESGTQETTAFKLTQENWQNKIHEAYRKILTPEQLEKYMASIRKKDRGKDSQKSKGSGKSKRKR